MGFVQRAFLAGAAGVAALVLVGCGSGSDLLSQSQAAQLTRQLDNVKLALADRDCSTARDALYTFEDKLNQLNGVNSTVVSNLDQGASTIEDLTSTSCAVPTQQAPKRTHTQTTRTQTEPDTTTVTTDTYPTQTYTAPTVTTETYPTQSYTSTTGGTPVAPQTTPTGPSNGGQGLVGGSSSYGATNGDTVGGDGTAGDTTSTTGASSGGDDSQGGSSQGAGGF